MLVYAYYVHAWWQQSSGKGVRSSGTEIIEDYELPTMGVLGTEPQFSASATHALNHQGAVSPASEGTF